MALRKSLVRLASNLTERRIRVHALILGICLWSVYAVDLATPSLRDRAGLLKGTDFLHFYTLGTLANRGQGSELYDMRAQAQLAPELVPDAAGLVYIPLYGPQVSLLFAPLARLTYFHALIAWWIISAVLYGTSCFLIWRLCPRLRSHGASVVIAALAYPALFALIAWGQSSAPALLAFALAYIALRGNRRFLAGLTIGLLAFKPSLGIAAGIMFLLTAEWKIVLGAIVTAATQIGIGWTHYGTGVIKSYVNALWEVPQNFDYVEPKPYMVHTLRAFWAMLIPHRHLAFALYVASAIIVLAMAIVLWRRRVPLELKYSGLLIATVLVAPHGTFYDLVILVPAFLLLSDWSLEKKTGRGLTRSNADLQCRSAEVGDNTWAPENPEVMPLLLYLCYGLPLLGVLTRWTHVQLSVLAFFGLGYVIWSIRASGGGCQA